MFGKLLKVSNLKVQFYTNKGIVKAVDGVDFELDSGETLGIVGESGSGKSVTAYSIMGLISYPGRIASGEVIFKGENLFEKTPKEMKAIQGNKISMIFQEPMSSLNPVFTIGWQIMEPLIYHKNFSRKEARDESIRLLNLVGIPSAESRIDNYPHQLSGGMRQRAMIAMALACRPELLIADEPTTALDVTIQAQILNLMKKLQSEFRTAIILITHNLGVVAQMVDKLVVMYAGRIMESGRVNQIFGNPLHPYTIGLLGSIPKINEQRDKLQVIEGTIPSSSQIPSGCLFHPRCNKVMEKCRYEPPFLMQIEPGHEVRCWIYEKEFRKEIFQIEQLKQAHQDIKPIKLLTSGNKYPLLEVRNLVKYFQQKSSFFSKRSGIIRAVDGVSLTLFSGETMGLVGESGCGKSTLGRTILSLIPPTSGEIIFEGKNINLLNKRELRRLRKNIQIVFQDPYGSLNPRMTVGEILGEALKIHHNLSGRAAERRIIELLEAVGMSAEHIYRYPHEFSGGQRQRIGVARALAVEPKLIICDEPVSALDVSVQAQVLNLLQDLKRKFNLTYLFIAHDLAVVRHISDRVAVMYLGKIVELADKYNIYEETLHPYSKALLEAVPIPDPHVKKEYKQLEGELPSPLNLPLGCRFHPRCREAIKICKEKEPPFIEFKKEHWIACHLYSSKNNSNHCCPN